MTNTPEATLFDPKAARQALVAELKAEKASPPGVKAAAEAARATASGDRLREDFRVFLFKIWKFLSLPTPTDIQYDIALYLQKGPVSSVILGFRGVAKSWITAAYVLWRLYCDPQANIMVVSGSAKRATGFTTFCLTLIRSVPFLKHLEPTAQQRQSSTAFDVGPADPDQNPSLYSLGISAQLQGFRADLIVADDVETTKNSLTALMRQKLLDLLPEFDAILKPGGRVVYLGTPQTEGSIYNALPGRGYSVRIWPAIYPNEEELRIYGSKLAPMLRKRLAEDPKLVGKSTEPTRFSNEDLLKRRLSWGTAGFALQFMLITQLADANKFPLRLHDLIVMSLDDRRGPDSITWSKDRDFVRSDLPLLGKDGDFFVRPSSISETTSEWEQVIGSIDPSGRGEDEASLTILARLNSRVFVLAQSSWLNGYEQRTLAEMATMLVRFRATSCYIESNFGGGMFGALLRPYIDKAWEVFNKDKPKVQHANSEIVEEPASRTQKELRILEVLEPITQQHRLVINTSVIESDYQSILKMDGEDGRNLYSLIYQYSYLTREKDCLPHDDRLDSLAAGVARWSSLFSLDPTKAAADRDEDRMAAELEKLLGAQDELHGVHQRASGGTSGRRQHLGSGRR